MRLHPAPESRVTTRRTRIVGRVSLAGALLVAVGALLGAALATRAAPTAQDQGEATIHLPFLMKDAFRSQTYKPPAKSPTPPPEPTATREPSPTVMATFTPEPTFTPPPVGDGKIQGKLTVDGDPAPPGLGDFGPGLLLRRCYSNDITDCDRVGRTGVYNLEGDYVFESPPALEAGSFYVVEWRNETFDDLFGDPQWLGLWRSKPINSYQADDVVDVAPIELADTKLTGPSKGTGFGGLPVTFTWDTRPREIGVYHWALSEPGCPSNAQLYDRADNWRSPAVGKKGEYTLRRYPPNTRVGIEYRYCWFVEIQAGDNGWGWSQERWALWFQFIAFEPFGLDRADWMVPIR